MRTWDRKAVTELLLECGAIALERYERLRVEVKGDHSLVTDADRAIEERFSREFDHPEEGCYLIGEETVATRSDEYVRAALRETAWVVDPIDGTAPYAHHIPTWGISLGLMRRGMLEEGAIYLPNSREMFVSEGQRVWYRSDSGLQDITEHPGKVRHFDPRGMVAITQGMARKGSIDLHNPIQALCCIVIPLAYLCLGRYLACIGRASLWDFAGGLPLLLKCGLKARLHDGSRLDGRVDAASWDLEPGSPRRWKLRGTGVFAPTEEIVERIAQTIRRPSS